MKACPFCGANCAELSNCKELEDCSSFECCGLTGYFTIVCNFNNGGCGASSGYFDTEEKAITAWENRVHVRISKEKDN